MALNPVAVLAGIVVLIFGLGLTVADPVSLHENTGRVGVGLIFLGGAHLLLGHFVRGPIYVGFLLGYVVIVSAWLVVHHPAVVDSRSQ